MRMPLIVGNWKMNGSLELVEQFGTAFAETGLPSSVEVALIPPAPYLAAMQAALAGTPVALGAQTLSPEPKGAHTGEISAAMLDEFDVRYVLVGHSERRSMYHEDDAAVLARAKAALAAGLVPVLCVGETLEQREAGQTEAVVLGQLEAVFDGLDDEQRKRLVVAYEPVWAIGTGRTATPSQAQEVHAAIRARLGEYDGDLAEKLRLLYGGSMKADNAAELLAEPDIDGGLIGGASLKTNEFLAICQSAG
ncbi:triose-phosphate isomerase [Halomonas sp. McH1-25]|uniref:triose-phosphate isomerase n=3 Tax=Halomonas TaxID=2745 RepID=UPI001EF59CFC|nr:MULTISPECIES: triose-phosphate isomerase [unclassified Halomonas]MCG7599442.1 triose-phosphate isomerase [Halomonas sp. McH1-25]MCP1362252.1 triose-phosphate isomerase [Halomonas sp. BBD45]